MIRKRSFPQDDELTLYASKKIVDWLAVGRDDEGKRTQERLAHAAGVTGATIHAIRTQTKTVGVLTARGLAEALGVSLEDFVAAAHREFGQTRRHLRVAEEAVTVVDDEDLRCALHLASSDGVVEGEFVSAYAASRPSELRGRSLLDDLIAAWRTWKRSGRLPAKSVDTGHIRDTRSPAPGTVYRGGAGNGRLDKADDAARAARTLSGGNKGARPLGRKRA